MISKALKILIDAKIAVPMACNPYMFDETHTHDGGDRINMGHYNSLEATETACHYELRHGLFGGSDYSGDDSTESNHRSLLRDYPDTFIDLYGGYWSYGLSLPITFGQDDDDESAEDLANTLIGLANDYPLYDEQDNYALIEERAYEAWDGYLRHDLESEVAKRFNVESVELVRADFDAACEKWEVFPEAEGHRDVIFPGSGDEHFHKTLFDLADADGRVTR